MLGLWAGQTAAGSFDTLIQHCVDPSASPDQMVDYATDKLGFKQQAVDHAAFRMAREEAFYVDAAGFREAEDGKDEPDLNLNEGYLKKMEAVRYADSWTSRTDTTGVDLQSEAGVSLIIWNSLKSPIKGCLLMTEEPHGPIAFPEKYETLIEHPSTKYGSMVHYDSAMSNFSGIIQYTKPTSAFNAFAPFRPQTTSLLFVSSYGNYNTD